METRVRVDGIYDLRTLKFLQADGIRHFGFNFSPKSFNFIQEHVFLEKIIPALGPHDQLDLTFMCSDDPMISKVLDDLKKVGCNTENVSIICHEWKSPPADLGHGFYLHYTTQTTPEMIKSQHFKGFLFSFSLFQEMHEKKLLTIFATNFFTRYGSMLDGKQMILSIGWRDNVFPGVMEIFDFDLVSFSIDSDIETCYRNVDLKKLGMEMNLHLPRN